MPSIRLVNIPSTLTGQLGPDRVRPFVTKRHGGAFRGYKPVQNGYKYL